MKMIKEIIFWSVLDIIKIDSHIRMKAIILFMKGYIFGIIKNKQGIRIKNKIIARLEPMSESFIAS